MRVFYWLFAGLLAAAAGLFALGNRADVTIDFWPVGPTLEMPLFVALVAALYMGVLLGAVIAWFGGGVTRRRAREARRRGDALARELADLKTKAAAAATAAAASPSAASLPTVVPAPTTPV